MAKHDRTIKIIEKLHLTMATAFKAWVIASWGQCHVGGSRGKLRSCGMCSCVYTCSVVLFWIVIFFEVVWFVVAVGSVCTHLTVRPGRLSPSFHFVSKSPESFASKKAVLWGIHWKGHNDNWEENQRQEIHNLKFESLKRKCKKYSYITYPHARVSGAEEEQAELNQSAKEQVLARNTLHDQHGKSSILSCFVVDH